MRGTRRKRTRVRIAQLSISPRTRSKVAGKHGLDVEDLRRHILGVSGLQGSWNDDPERGRRAFVEVPFHGRRVVVCPLPRAGSRRGRVRAMPQTVTVRTDLDEDDFYEEDEPVERLLAAFDSGEKFRTGLPKA